MGEGPLADVLKLLGNPPDKPPPHAVQHGAAGTLLALPIPGPSGPSWRGVWIQPNAVTFLGDPSPSTGLSRSFHLTGDSAKLIDLLADAARAYLDQAEAVDEHLSNLQRRGREVQGSTIWAKQREVAALRAHIGRAVVVAAEVEGPSSSRFPGAETALAAVSREVDRAREFAASVQQSLSDLILLRSAEEANRIAEAANQLSRTSNRIAELANISNIRMLGLTYIALAIGVVGAVVLIPNTGATILGMPSAGWVPGYWVDGILVVLAVVPFVAVFSRPWIRKILRDLGPAEARAEEGLRDLPELAAEGSPRLSGGRNHL
ncbi:MAG: CorA family divalent cation transporter [Thermoplasmata archaeon]|nr:CorA family divalent cation transporter [Thermoplasmata archaeon]